jgi:glutathione synthase/RimK-type ligase-like ATP-grasp enzyme
LEAVEIDVYSESSIDEINDCDAFMWRPTPSFNVRNYATKIIRCVEEVSDIPCFFNTSMLRSFEDKVSQKYEFMAAKIPTPQTYVFWSRETALNFCKTAKYPMVLKLANGYQSYNVLLLENYFSAEFYIDLLFGSGTVHLGYKPA